MNKMSQKEDGKKSLFLEEIAEFAVDNAEINEKFKTKLAAESETYYQNNVTYFKNALSLLAVNSLEAHSLIHQMEA